MIGPSGHPKGGVPPRRRKIIKLTLKSLPPPQPCVGFELAGTVLGLGSEVPKWVDWTAFSFPALPLQASTAIVLASPRPNNTSVYNRLTPPKKGTHAGCHVGLFPQVLRTPPMPTRRLFLKKSCPYCAKVTFFLSEAGLAKEVSHTARTALAMWNSEESFFRILWASSELLLCYFYFLFELWVLEFFCQVIVLTLACKPSSWDHFQYWVV